MFLRNSDILAQQEDGSNLNQAKKKNILILSYFFPPCNKVGGRRWAKFGKYLTQKGHEVHVLNVGLPVNGICPWEKDTTTFKNKIKSIPYKEHRPYYKVNKSPGDLTGKINYRLSLYKEKLFPESIKGDRNDISRLYGTSLQRSASELIKNYKIDTVITTGGPFHWCYESIQLKKKYPDVKFIVDLRDFWTGGENYISLAPNDKQAEDLKEKECIEYADHIITPAERIATFLRKKYVSSTQKISVIPHAYDAEEIPSETIKGSNSEIITIAYGGILYENMEDGIQKLIALLKSIRNRGKNLRLDIYSFNRSYETLFEKEGVSDFVHYHQPISPIDLFKKFRETDLLLQLRAGRSYEEHFKSTKFYELIALRRPILYFGPDGDVSDFLVKEKLGFSGNNPTEELCSALLQNLETNTIPVKDFSVGDYEFSKVTEDLLALMN